MATTSKKQSDPDEAVKYSDKTGEETEPEPFLQDEDDFEDSSGVPGQIVYPEVEVDAERAAAYAGGKVDTLDPDDEEKTDREQIQDDIDNYPRDEEETFDEDGKGSTKASKK